MFKKMIKIPTRSDVQNGEKDTGTQLTLKKDTART